MSSNTNSNSNGNGNGIPVALSPVQYSTEWCELYINEPASCKIGALFYQDVQASSNSWNTRDIVQTCVHPFPNAINLQTREVSEAMKTEGFRAGCIYSAIYSPNNYGKGDSIITPWIITKPTDEKGDFEAKQIAMRIPTIHDCAMIYPGDENASMRQQCKAAYKIRQAEILNSSGQTSNGFCPITRGDTCIRPLNECLKNNGDTDTCASAAVGCYLGDLNLNQKGQIQANQGPAFAKDYADKIIKCENNE